MIALGFRGAVRDVEAVLKAARAAAQGDVSVQLMDAALVCGGDHLLTAVEHARRAFHRGTNSSRDFGLEVLLYASGERQLERALAKMGLTKATTALALVVAAAGESALEPAAADAERALQRLGFERDDRVLDASPEKLRRFGIPDQEAATLPPGRAADLVLERVALVDALK